LHPVAHQLHAKEEHAQAARYMEQH
jgi:hypothetical protein